MRFSRKVLFLQCAAFGFVCFVGGLFASGVDLSPLAVWLSQTGEVSLPLLEKIRLVPAMFITTGAEVLLLSITFGQSEDLAIRLSDFKSASIILLLVLSSAVGLLSLNFEGIHLAYRLAQTAGKSASENTASIYGEEYGVIRALKDQTPQSAAIFVRTTRPLQFLLSYELYPRRFYFFPDRSYPAESIPASWFVQHKIQWLLEISDANPVRFTLRRRQGGSP